jgi:predicted RNA binding protein YcfA (HicA-like mRNA interferase family)
MPKRKVFSGQDICDLLGEHGFVAVRQRGSHRVMQKRRAPAPLPFLSPYTRN